MDIFLIAILAVLILFGVIFCAIRGLKRSVVRLIFIVIAGVAALFVAPILSSKLSQFKPIVEFKPESLIMQCAAASPTLATAINGIDKVIWSIIAYPFVFIILCILFTIPSSIINRKINRNKKGAGALCGIVNAVVAFTIALAPLCSLGSLVMDVTQDSLIQASDVQSLADTYGIKINAEKLMKYNNVLKIEGKIGEPMLEIITTVKDEGNSVSMFKELINLLPIYNAYDAKNPDIVKLLNVAADCADKSSFINDAFDEIQTTARSKWKNGDTFFGYDPKNPGDGNMKYVATYLCSIEKNLTLREATNLIKQLSSSANAK